MNNELRARIFEMTLAAFGASACASAAQPPSPAKVPSAVEVTRSGPSQHGEASCSAAGCGGKADDTGPAVARAPAAPAASEAPGASAPAAPAVATPAPAVALDSETTSTVVQKPESAGEPSQPSAEAASKAAPKHASKPKGVHKKRAADDQGCGAGSCASAK